MALLFLATTKVDDSRQYESTFKSTHRSRLNTSNKVSSEPREASPDEGRSPSYQQNESSFHSPSLQTPCLDSIEKEDLLCNNNFQKSCYQEKGSPIVTFPPSLISWPPASNIKSNRVAAARHQVEKLSKLIKMLIDDDSQAASNVSGPFSKYVDLSAIQSCIGGMGAARAQVSVSWQDLELHLKAGRAKEAKMMIRGVDWDFNEGDRREIWMGLCQHHSKESFTDYYYWDTVQQLYGTREISKCDLSIPSFVDEDYLIDRWLSDDGKKICVRILSVVAYSFPAITYAATVYPLVAVLLHYMEESEVYNCVSAMLDCTTKFIYQTKSMHDIMWRTVETLARKHVKGSFSLLQKFGISAEQISDAFQKWIWWMLAYLPFPHLVRIIDCFLLEGNKVLLRCSLAIFHLFMKYTGRDAEKGAILNTKGIEEAIMLYCQNINVSPFKLLKTAFGIRAFGKAEIQRVINHTKTLLNSEDRQLPTVHGTASLIRGLSLEALPDSQAQSNIQMFSHTLTVKELLKLWSWIPLRMRMQHPTLVYTTEEHGSSITTFYRKIEKYEPYFLLVRTLNDEVFGAYCSAALSNRKQNDEFGNKQTYFGTGETFLFSLRPNVIKYEWVGVTRQRENPNLTSVEHSCELFIHADNDMVSVGGGSGHGLMMDHELRFGKTESCQTFNNEPLCDSGNFEIKVVEVFAFSKDV